MNILLLDNQNLTPDGDYIIGGDKFKHLKKVLKVNLNQNVFAGFIGGKMGYATVKDIQTDHIILKAEFNLAPPTPLPITIVIALPRPKMLRRILRNISMLGVKKVYLINTLKVERSFWDSNLLKPDNLKTYLLQGLEQSKDTILPVLEFRNKFKPFVEDELPAIIKDTNALVAHPGDFPPFPQGISDPITLAIGPEGGFSEFEVKLLNTAGFKTVHIGSRILRTETALVALISQHAALFN